MNKEKQVDVKEKGKKKKKSSGVSIISGAHHLYYYICNGVHTRFERIIIEFIITRLHLT